MAIRKAKAKKERPKANNRSRGTFVGVTRIKAKAKATKQRGPQSRGKKQRGPQSRDKKQRGPQSRGKGNRNRGFT